MERSGTGAPYPQGVNFNELLDWHLTHGTHPEGTPERHGRIWSNKTFANACSPEGAKEFVKERTVSHWRNGSRRPNDIDTIIRALFGENGVYVTWRADLIAAHTLLFAVCEETSERIAIPRPTAYFLGRDAAVDALRAALLASPEGAAILVQGGPGIGKTTLTQAIGNHPEIVTRFGEGRWFVALENAASNDGLRDAVLGALGLEPKDGFAAALKRLGAGPGLLVLDNLETPWDPKAERRAVEATLSELAAVPGLNLLASFRGRDFVGGPAWQVRPLTGLDAADATTLFRRYATEIAERDPDLPRFIAALGGIPLAIELVARRAYGRATLAALWKRWNAIGAELAAHPDFEPARLTSLPRSIELSWSSERLTEDARRLFRLLGQLPAGLCAEDRDALLGKSGEEAEEALRRIGLAIERDTRLDLLPPIRDHARRQHAPESPDKEAWPRHYLTLTRERGEAIGSNAGEGAVARLTPELSNIEAAIRAVLRNGRRAEAMAALYGFYKFVNIASLAAPVLEDLAAACRQQSDGTGEANCMRGLGDIALARSDQETARAAYQQALPLFQAVSFLAGEAHCIERLGDIALARSDHEAAREAYERAMALYRQVGALLGEANCTHRLGVIALRRSDHEAARDTFERAMQLYRQVGDLLGEANCIHSLGDIARRRSDLEAARQAYEGAMALYRQVGSSLGEANCIRRLGDIAFARSDHEAARDAYERAMPLYRQVGNQLGEANCIHGLGDIALARSDHEAARQAYERAMALYRQVGSLLCEANCIESFGDLATALSDPAEARSRFEAALALYRRIGDRDSERYCQDRLDRLVDE